MTTTTPETTLDPRFSSEDATPSEWSAARDQLHDAKSYQLTTVRADGAPAPDDDRRRLGRRGLLV